MKKWPALLVVIFLVLLCGYFCWPSLLFVWTRYQIQQQIASMSPEVKSIIDKVPEQMIIKKKTYDSEKMACINLGGYRYSLPQPEEIKEALAGKMYVLQYSKYSLLIHEPKPMPDLDQAATSLQFKNGRDFYFHVLNMKSEDLARQTNMQQLLETGTLLTLKPFLSLAGANKGTRYVMYDRGDFKGTFVGANDSANFQDLLMNLYLLDRTVLFNFTIKNKANAHMSDVIEFISTLQIEPLDTNNAASTTSSCPAISPAE